MNGEAERPTEAKPEKMDDKVFKHHNSRKMNFPIFVQRGREERETIPDTDSSFSRPRTLPCDADVQKKVTMRQFTARNEKWEQSEYKKAQKIERRPSRCTISPKVKLQ
jgi:hypothetical protein